MQLQCYWIDHKFIVLKICSETCTLLCSDIKLSTVFFEGATQSFLLLLLAVATHSSTIVGGLLQVYKLDKQCGEVNNMAVVDFKCLPVPVWHPSDDLCRGVHLL